MTTDRLPWEVIETLPFSDSAMLASWEDQVTAATSDEARSRALVGRALALYWAPALGVVEGSAPTIAERRRNDVHAAESLARKTGDPDLIAIALLGRLYACWGPPEPSERRPLLDELEQLRPLLVEPELRVRIVEWHVVHCFDGGDLPGVWAWIDEFHREAAGIDSKLFARREVLWRANLAMLEGRLDESLQLNEEAIASTADLAGSPFSFQNVAITMAISKYLRRGLADVLDAIRSIRASSGRVEANWDVGLAFALSEVGEFDEAGALFDRIARDHFAVVPRDLNWLVATQLLGLVAVNLGDTQRAAELLDALRPYAELDGTHGSGYASYGPVARVVALLAACVGDDAEAEAWFGFVLSSRAPGPWTALARSDLAHARQHTDPAGSLVEAERAEQELRRFGLEVRADEARTLAIELGVAGHGGPVARLEAGTWTLTHPTGRCLVRDGVGMQSLSRLLAHAGEPVNAVDLDRRVDAALPRLSVTEPTIDRSARDAYRRRLRGLDELASRTADQDAEREFLLKELSGAAHAPAASREIEKARVRVTTAIRRAIDAIAERSPGLGDHLRSSIETGRRCSYQPGDGTAWSIER